MTHTPYQPLKRGLLLLALAFGCLHLAAQDSYLLSQQWLSRLNRNPAAAGVSGSPFDLSLFYRNQWDQLDNTLSTVVVNAEGLVPSLRSNLGLSFSYDKPGAAKQDVNLLASYAFRFAISDKLQLSLGLAAGIMNRRYDPAKLHLEVGGDPGMDYEKQSSLKADFSAGFELTSQRLTVGMGIVHLGNNSAGTMDDAYNQQQVYSYARYYIPVVGKLDIAPTAAWLHYDGDNLFEFGATGLFDGRYWLGAAFRPSSAVVFSAGLELYLFRLGYAYDLAIGDSKVMDGGIHELMLQFSLGRRKKR